MDDVLVAENVRRTYGDTVALDGVSLTVGTGEVLGLVGPNGAGKTTLVRALTGTTDADGTVRIFGHPPEDVNTARIGLLPQEFTPPERLTPRELLDYYGGLYDHVRETDAVLDDVGLLDSADVWYENLSGGQRRRTCVGTALVNDPELLILDEPTTGIDPAGRQSLWTLLDDLAAAGTTVLITTHYMEEAERLADRVGLLADGRLLALDTPDALIDAHGGESRLMIETNGTAGALETIDLNYRTAIDQQELTVVGVQPEAIGQVVRALDEQTIAYESLTWTQPDLEDVYLDLTGQAVAGGRAIDASDDRTPAEEVKAP
jgi:ABC-2 type transport system ATP-binding protein